VNEGTIRADSSGRFLQLGDGVRLTTLTNAGTIEAANGGRLEVRAENISNQAGAEITTAGGNLVAGGTSFTNSGSIEAADGTITISNTTFNSAATIRVAAGARIQLSGMVTMLPASILEVVFGGVLASEIGQFSSTGSLALDGMVRVSLSSGFVPSLGDEFAFLSYNARSGQFIGVDEADGTPGVGYDLTYGPIDATLRAVLG